MMRFKVVFISLLLVAGASFSVFAFWGKSPLGIRPVTSNVQDDEYAKRWKTVDSLEKKQLPQSARDEVTAIYTRARSEKNHPQQLKATLFLFSYNAVLEEEGYKISMRQLHTMAAEFGSPHKEVAYSLLGELYYTYYQQNRYAFYDRSVTRDFDPEDLKTWDLERVFRKSVDYYLLSLAHPEISQSVPVETYLPLLDTNPQTRNLRPVLFDFLAHRALTFFKNEELGLVRPAQVFSVDKPEYFSESDRFAKLTVPFVDSLSGPYYALRIFQELERLHLSADRKPALIEAQLERLDFVRAQSILPSCDTLYYAALNLLTERYADNPEVAQAWYRIAELHAKRGEEYKASPKAVNAANPETSPARYKWELKKALEICTQTIAKYPGSFGALQCEALRHQLERPSLSFTVEEVLSINKPAKALIRSRNVDKLYFRIVNLGWEYRGVRFSVPNEELIETYLSRSVVKEWSLDMQNDGDLQEHLLEMDLPALKAGYYVLLAGTDPSFTREKQAVAHAGFGVSNLAYAERQGTAGMSHYHVFHRETGEPVANATVRVYSQKYNSAIRQDELTYEKTLHTDRHGEFSLVADKQYRGGMSFDITKGNDRLNSLRRNFLYESYERDEEDYSTHFFLDRGIYRPGQTLFFKGIHLHHGPGGKISVAPNRELTVDLYDMNGEELGTIDVVTNEYGTFSGTFILPVAGLTGQLYIEDDYSEKYFSVEEYKRPRFEVSFQPVKGVYKLGQKVNIKGQAQAYAGAQIDGAKVVFRVNRQVYYPFYRGYFPGYQASTEIVQGELRTDENGFFEIEFTASPDQAAAFRDNPAFRFTVSADVTDLNGETRSASASVSVGYQAMTLHVEVPSLLSVADKKGIVVRTKNLNGEPVTAKGGVKIYRLKQPSVAYRARVWEQPDRYSLDQKAYKRMFPNDLYANENDPETWPLEQLVFEAAFDTGTKDSLRLDKLASWKPGKYLLLASAPDSFGTQVSEKRFFTVYSEKSKTMPENVPLLLIPLKVTAEPGEKASLLVGTALKKGRILYEIEHQGKIIQKKWLKLSKSVQKIEVPVEEQYRGNFTLHFTMVHHNRFYRYSQLITVPYTNKQIDIVFETFRDKLLPGQQEEWRLKLKGKQGEKLAAEMLISMYDASLDQFASNEFSFNPYTSYYSSRALTEGYGFDVLSSGILKKDWEKRFPYPVRTYESLNWFGYEPYNYFYSGKFKRVSYRNLATTPQAEMNFDAMSEREGNVPVLEEMLVASAGVSLQKTEDTLRSSTGNSSGQNPDAVKARTNFNETAFFYPHLRTDEEGNILVKFTAPESLTRWKIQGIAHTRDLKIGQVRKELVTRKELMVMPNLPRFLREGDKLVLVSKISNLSEGDLEGQAKLLLFDALTQQPIDSRFALQQAQQPFSVKKGQSTSVFWTLTVPQGIDAVSCRIVATAGDFSDGEETVLPVLTNRTLVTESLPLPVRKKGTHTFTLRSLTDSKKSTTLSPHRLTLEFTSNPAWYAIQALPYLMEYPYDCAEQVFSRFYANALATHLLNSSPRIKAVFDSWKSSSPEAFLSKLEKNQELKALVLEETPWVLDASDETERKRRVALLFDFNHMQNQLASSLHKLQGMQLSSGGWPWFSGMSENRTVTQHIVAGFGHLNKFGIKIPEEMLEKALHYLDQKLVEEYQQLVKKAEKEKRDFRKENHLGQIQVHYLYARSFFKEVTPGAEQLPEVLTFYREQVARYWTSLDLYTQGMLALAAHRNELKSLSTDIVKSIRQRALHHEEMGMYWKQNVAGYGWYQSPIETQALLIEMFDEVADDQATVEALKVWLLKHKQTADWKTTKATTEAIYALLSTGTDLLATEEIVEVKLGGQTIDPKQKGASVEAGTGYYKVAWNATEIRPEMGNVSVTKKTDGVAWGALYWQYFEQSDKIKSAETGLKLSKKLFKVENTDRGPVIVPVETSVLAPGDKIRVRIELRTDRHLEYVHLKDMRASGFEPVNVLSGYRYRNGLGYYESTRDASTNFFFDYISKGTYVFEYDLFVAQSGDFSNGISTIQCMYAPEFTSHSEGTRVIVK